MPRCLVIGLDCAPPALVFERCRHLLPNLSGLMERGLYGPLRSSDPPITVPAWVCMTTGRDPGELGLYGFRNGVEGSYSLRVATSGDLRDKRVWDYAGDAGKKVAALFVPLTSPPTPLRGQLVSCFLTPDADTPHTFPRGLGAELRARFGPYEPDVPDFRTDELDRVAEDLMRTAAQHFDIAAYVLDKHKPDFAMMVEIGTDRLNHAFYAHLDERHPRHDPASPHVAFGARYYAYLDQRIGELLALAGEDTDVLVVSDHGARPMLGSFAINEWLAREGYLRLSRAPEGVEAPRAVGVDWAHTRALGEGGYYARIFLNVEGRDPEGVIPAHAYDAERDRLAEALRGLRHEDGRPVAVRVDYPDRVYRRVRGRAPDMLVYLDELDYRSVGTVGHGRLFLETNDRGPDACNHDFEGIVIAAGPSVPARGRVEGASLYDVLPTALGCLGVPTPAGLLGRSLLAP